MATSIPRGFDFAAGRRHLTRCDPQLAYWMGRVGTFEHDFSKSFHPVDALARSILHQQLSGKAAATITGRVEALMPGPRISAEGLAGVDDVALRGAGVSGNKVAALRDLAAKAEAGVVPTVRGLARMDDTAVIEHLTQVRGIGRWTVEMLLMFRCGRADILPVDDLGIRKGAQIVRGLETMPKPRELLALGESWGPYRTLASFYLWRVVDVANALKPIKRSQD